jgi:hypothetical protein
LADKGFPLIQEDANKAGAFVVMPPFKRGERQFSTAENVQGFACSNVRFLNLGILCDCWEDFGKEHFFKIWNNTTKIRYLFQ